MSSVAAASEKEDLFFPSSDSEDEAPPSSIKAPKSINEGLPSQDLVSQQLPPSSNGGPRRTKRADSRSSDIVPLDSPPSSGAAIASSSSNPLKRPVPPREVPSPSQGLPPGFTGGYLGEFICEGWSLSKGKGYCSAGSKVVFERPKTKVAEEKPQVVGANGKAGPTRIVNGKAVNAKGQQVGKQMTLGSMLGKKGAAPPAKKVPAKTVTDNIIRFRNDRGFEVGRLSVNEANFLVHLLDTGVSE